MAGSELNHQDYALTDPREDLAYSGFPTREAPAKMFRAKAKANGAWYFASSPKGGVGAGRFDLTDPRGTCYWASDAATALGERLGPDMLAAPGTIPASFLEPAEVATADGADGRFADLGNRRAVTHFAVTGELSKTDDYAQAQRYATTFDSAGLAGIFYAARYSGDQSPNAIAVFGDKGPDTSRQVDADTIPAIDVARSMGLTIIGAPSDDLAAAFDVVNPSETPAPKKRP
ncbi:RES domain-containing protein [Curtobacterium sp. MCSS17_016]|uniref:RES domain-containing protein n=1 Tax=Curtobacterium sp. MCSS17_016 TaxID=2175644 RepID=UPI0015E8A425|nr:RES domain-containing protein [Curtobacterium sp. MCSS17_016]WIE81335.1 RES domain-containing protein [Curtobacterium sp. MCSS17_016]